MKLFSISATLIAAATILALGAPMQTAAQPKAGAKPKAVHGAWEIRCAGKACAMNQVGKNAKGVPVVLFQLTKLPKPQKVEGGEVVASARIVLPYKVVLTHGVGFQIDGGSTLSIPYTLCSHEGCEAQPQFSPDLIGKLAKGTNLNITVAVPTSKGPGELTIRLSLAEFKKAYGAL